MRGPVGARVRRWSLALAAGASVALQFTGRLSLSCLALVLWLVTLAALDRPTLRRLWMPRFLLVSVLIGLAAGVLLGTHDHAVLGVSYSSSGLAAGALMVVRGTLILGLTSWGSRALFSDDGARLRRVIRHPELAAAAATAVRLIPGLVERLRAGWKRPQGVRRRLRLSRSLVALVYHAARIAEETVCAAGGCAPPLKVAVVGPQGSGKTTTLRALARKLREQGLTVGGVVQPAHHGDGGRVGYELEDVANGRRHPFARVRAASGAPPGFDFDPAGWAWASAIVRGARQRRDVLVVDELGRLEAEGQGHIVTLRSAVRRERARVHLFGVRADREGEIARQLGPFDLVLHPAADAATVEAYSRRIAERLASGNKVPVGNR